MKNNLSDFEKDSGRKKMQKGKSGRQKNGEKEKSG